MLGRIFRASSRCCFSVQHFCFMRGAPPGDSSSSGGTPPGGSSSGGTPSKPKWAKVAAGYSHALAIDSNGQLYAWGNNTNGQLGDGTTADKSTPHAYKASIGHVALVTFVEGPREARPPFSPTLSCTRAKSCKLLLRTACLVHGRCANLRCCFTVQVAITYCLWHLHIRTLVLTYTYISTCTTFCYCYCLLFLILLLKIATAASRCVCCYNSLCR